MKKLFHLSVIAALLLTVAAAVEFPAYQVTPPPNPSPEAAAAATDLNRYWGEITGAEAASGDKAAMRFFIGRRAPNDRRTLAPGEIRATESGGDIYLYGDGVHGDVFAVYGFLEDVAGCRWYSPWGDARIPRRTDLRLNGLKYASTPAFRSFELINGEGIIRNLPGVMDFYRRNRIYLDGEGMKRFSGMPRHSHGRIVPPGHLAPEKRIGNLYGAHKLFAGKAYFKSNPEYFTLNSDGKRVPNRHFCYSNPALRKTMTENFRTLIRSEYTGGDWLLEFSLNDLGGPLCSCAKCEKLVKKYGDPAGPYWDYLLEFAAGLKNDYPRIIISVLAYWISESTPPGLKALPDNVLLGYAPLWRDYFKPLDSPANAGIRDNITGWNRLSKRLYLYLYSATYPRFRGDYPLVGNINQWVENFRFARRNGVEWILCENSAYPVGNVGFNELRSFLLSKLAWNPDLNADALIDEFMANYYGAAAPLMRGYLNELEAQEAATSNQLSWTCDLHVRLNWLTPEKIADWQRRFDRMEELTLQDKRRNLNIRRARSNLDETEMYLIAMGKQQSSPAEVSALYRRWEGNLDADFSDMFGVFSGSAALRDKQMRATRRRRSAAMETLYAMARGTDKPLPEALKNIPSGRIHRLSVCGSRSYPVSDPEAAFGQAAELPAMDVKFISVGSWMWKNPLRFEMVRSGRRDLIDPVKKAEISQAPFRYRFYKAGKVKLTPDALIGCHRIGFNIPAGSLFDLRRPDAEYDVYLSFKFVPPNQIRCDEAILVELQPET